MPVNLRNPKSFEKVWSIIKQEAARLNFLIDSTAEYTFYAKGLPITDIGWNKTA